MTIRAFKFAAVAAILLYLIVGGATGTRAQSPEGNYGVGVPSVFLPKYLGFRAQQLGSATPDVMRVKLGYVKGLSRSFTAMNGEAALNLASGAFTVNLARLTPGAVYSVGIVDAPDIDGVPDVPFSLGTLLALSPNALLSGVLRLNLLPPGFTVDRVAVVEGAAWGGQTLAAGSVNVFQKLFFRRASLVDASTGVTLFDETTAAPLLYALVPPLDFETESLLGGFALKLSTASRADATSSGASKRSVQLDKLISRGATLFFEETFAGNGRTCGTCHPASNNLTIDPAFIATLPANDPLFVAEFNPALAQLERPVLMRQFGLILENLDGLRDPTNKFVMRGVPHTLGLQVSLQQAPNQSPAEMTGWSGDGAPGTGSLREFATGAVTQHFTKRLNRVAGTDFVLPKDKQLDAMEAFQLSLGRDRDFDLTRITFNDAHVETGKGLFLNGTPDNPNAGGRCAGCHNNAGALLGGLNLNINTNVEDAVHPARRIQDFPKDGGFGQTSNGDGTFGNRTFNLAPVVEAADTAPFFHNNLVDTLEGVVGFYTGPEFNNPRAAGARFAFDQTQIDQLSDFMRGINTLQNIDVASRELQELLANLNDPIEEQNKRLQTAFEDTQDAIDVLNEGGIFPTAVSRLVEARNFIAQAQASGSGSQRRTLAQQAITKLGEARTIVAVQS
jgi:cytochrome c peroxidase